jgi:hypothetical protein
MPNGLIAHLAGLFWAPQNNLGVLDESGLLDMLKQHAIQPALQEDDLPLCCYFQVYSNSVYKFSPVMVSPFSGVQALTSEQGHGTQP